MPRRIKWGVIGSGGIAQRRTIPEGLLAAANAELVGVYSRDAVRNRAVAEAFHISAADSIRSLLAMGVEAVYVASPPAAHLEQVRQCAAAGKHVLCEKPLALSVADAEAMGTACREAGVLLGTALMMRFQSQHAAARELIQGGRLGRPVFARAQLSCWYPPLAGAWRQNPETGGGGSLMDLGGHAIDLLEMFFGPVAAVSCLTNRTVQDYPVEDSAVVTLRFANGATGVVDVFFCIPDDSCRRALELYGSAGSILATGTIGQGDRGEMLAYLPSADAGYDAGQARAGGSARPIAPPPVNMYRAEIEEFSQAIIDGRPPANDGAQGIRSQQVLAACYDSAERGCVVRIK